MLDNKDIALQLTLKALELGYIPKKRENFFAGEDPFQETTKYAADQISDFFIEIYNKLGNA